MSLAIGIVGLPNVGKSTLFNTLTKKGVPAENYPFCTIDPSVGVVAVPDERLSKLAVLSKSAKMIPAAVEFVDIAGLVKGAAAGEGLGNQFLAHIREVDAILHLVRGFVDDEVVHVGGKIDPADDMETIKIELALANLDKPTLYAVNTKAGKPLADLTGLPPHLLIDAADEKSLDELIRVAYQLLNLITFFTTGEKETRAWTTRAGSIAPQAGRAIHSDFHDKFIRAEVVAYADLIGAGSYAAARARGLLRTEGKKYIVKDGDVIEFKI